MIAPEHLLRLVDNADEGSFERQLLAAVKALPNNYFEGRRRIYEVYEMAAPAGYRPWGVRFVEAGTAGAVEAEFSSRSEAEFYAMMLNGLFMRLVEKYLHCHRCLTHVMWTARAGLNDEGF